MNIEIVIESSLALKFSKIELKLWQAVLLMDDDRGILGLKFFESRFDFITGYSYAFIINVINLCIRCSTI